LPKQRKIGKFLFRVSYLLSSGQVNYSHFASHHWNLLQAILLFARTCTLHSSG